ncbi:MAG: SusC/RagA family TonB-linked outer membrane protein [Bacteroidetes bacterium]|nr:SusC/RagA family TonB-linked outer membrane protein [Candidatus Colenecus caballi]
MTMKYRNRLLRAAAALSLATLPSLLFAQKAGDVISGVIEDKEGPMMMVNVTERDAADRIVAHAITDINGEFSFRLVSPKNRIQITYVGYETVDIPITKTYYEIMMNDNTEIPEVEIKADRVQETSGLPIPLREASNSVQTINMEEFEGLGITTVDEALQGRIAGLDIVFNSGDLGARSTMHLRGVATMTGDANPLIVVDGNIWEVASNLVNNFDFQNNSQDSEKVSELLNINPEDIASILVLKDAAATAIWGARGSNGVMEIKTKRGQRGKTRVNYSYRFNGTWQPEGYQLMTGDEYTMYIKEAFFNPRLDDALVNGIPEINYVQKGFSEYEMFNDNTDWVGAVKQFGAQHSHNVSVSGGGDKANFRISAGFDNQTGSVIGQKMNRFTTRIAFDYFVSDRIKVTTNFSMTYSKNKQNSAAIGSAMRMMPNMAIYYQDANGNSTGEYYQMLATASKQLPQQSNPIAEADYKQQYSTSLNVNPEFQLVYNLLGLENNETKLTYDARVTFGVTNSGSDSFTPMSLSNKTWSDSGINSTSSNASKSSSIGTTHSLTFIPHLRNENHSFMAMVRFQLNTSNNKNQSMSKYGLPTGRTLTSPGLVGNISDGGFSTGASESRSMNATFTAHYSYKSKYSFDLTTRSDGSTRFGDAKRWGTFPAVSGRWNISDEKWFDYLRQTGWLTMMAARVSWGITGNAPGSDGLYYSKYSTGQNSYMSTPTIYPSNIRLSSMQWEETTSWNLGFDFGLIHDRLNANVDIYTRTTEKMLNNGYSIPTSSGFESLAYVNEGSMSNEGWEFNLNANRIISKRIGGKDLNVNVNISFADNTNQILDMNPTMLEKMNRDWDRKNGSYLSYVALKNAFGSIYGFKYLGVYQYSKYSEVEVPGVSGPNAPVVKDADGNVILNSKGKTKPMMFDYGSTNQYTFVGGDAIYEDINHDGNINELDIVYLGSSLPKLNGGFGVNMSWGRLSWNNQFNFRYGNRIVNGSRMNAECMYNTDNTSAAVNWRWRVEGDETVMPRALYQAGFNYLGSDRYVEDGSFLRWNYTALSYSLDPTITKKIGLGGVSFNLNLNNVLVWTKYTGMDPEVGGGTGSVAQDNSQTPRSKQFTFGVSVQF